jgi:hypothetical protein
MTPTEFLQQYNIDRNTVVYTGDEDDDTRDGIVLSNLLDEYSKQAQKSALKYWHDFYAKLESRVDQEDSDTMSVGEFVMDHFDLWK